MRMQKGIKSYGVKEKESVMKEIINLSKKNDYFGEIDKASVTEKMKRRALPLLMFVAMKRNGDLKTRGCVYGGCQRPNTDKAECSSPTTDFFAFKHTFAVIA